MRRTDRSSAGRLSAVAAVSVAMLAGACVQVGADSGLRGSILGDGSSTVFPITEAIAEEFRRENREVNIKVSVSGTGGGFSKFCNGETDIQNASRPIKDVEERACRAKGVGYIELQVANDGLAVVVSPKNTWVECLTIEELRAIWRPRSAVTRWSQVRAGFPDVALKLFGPGTDSGTFDYFTKEVNGEEGASRTDYTASEDDNTLVTGVNGSSGGLAYFGFAYYAANQDKLRLVGVDGGDGCVVPTDDSVRTNAYRPLSRPLLLYVRTSSLRRPEVEAFIDFYLANVNLLLADVGYTPLSETTLEEQETVFRKALGP